MARREMMIFGRRIQRACVYKGWCGSDDDSGPGEESSELRRPAVLHRPAASAALQCCTALQRNAAFRPSTAQRSALLCSAAPPCSVQPRSTPVRHATPVCNIHAPCNTRAPCSTRAPCNTRVRCNIHAPCNTRAPCNIHAPCNTRAPCSTRVRATPMLRAAVLAAIQHPCTVQQACSHASSSHHAVIGRPCAMQHACSCRVLMSTTSCGVLMWVRSTHAPCSPVERPCAVEHPCAVVERPCAERHPCVVEHPRAVVERPCAVRHPCAFMERPCAVRLCCGAAVQLSACRDPNTQMPHACEPPQCSDDQEQGRRQQGMLKDCKQAPNPAWRCLEGGGLKHNHEHECWAAEHRQQPTESGGAVVKLPREVPLFWRGGRFDKKVPTWASGTSGISAPRGLLPLPARRNAPAQGRRGAAVAARRRCVSKEDRAQHTAAPIEGAHLGNYSHSAHTLKGYCIVTCAFLEGARFFKLP
eukprot:366433-Chlamydomonas_euryale.AAC.16